MVFSGIQLALFCKDNQPVLAYGAGQYAAHAVESGRPAGPGYESADITHFGEEICDGVPAPVIAWADLGPPEYTSVL